MNCRAGGTALVTARVTGRLTALVLCLLAAGCGGGSGAAEPVDAEGVPRSWGLVEIGEEIASFPPFEGPPVLGRARHLRLSGDAMLVAEAMDGRVHRFGLDGTHLGSFGRKGAGPGEFAQITDLHPWPDGTVWLIDRDNARWTHLAEDGQVLEERPSQGLGTRFHPLPDGSILLPGSDVAGSIHRVAGPGSAPPAWAPPESAQPDDMNAFMRRLVWVAMTHIVVSAGDAWVLANDTVFRVVGVGASTPAVGPPVQGQPVFTLPESMTAEIRARTDAAFPRGSTLFFSGMSAWQDRGVLVRSGTPARTLGYAVEEAGAEGTRPRVTRLVWTPDRPLVRGVLDLHLRGDTLFVMTSTDIRLFRVALP